MKYLFISLLLAILSPALAQDYNEISNLKTGEYEDKSPQLLGLWVVEQVTVGEELLTPTAKWFEFMANGEQLSGNGWLQNYKGTWRLESASDKLFTTDMDGQPDPYGPLSVQLEGNRMTWQRQEDGMPVIIKLRAATDKPRAPWDHIVGRWSLVNAERLTGNSGSVQVIEYTPIELFFRWDNEYRAFDKDGNRIERGIWQINAHAPWLRLVPNGDKTEKGQTVSFEEGQMIFETKESDSIVKRYFERVRL